MFKAQISTGAAAVLLAIAFNVPFSILATTFDYPDILRKPAGEVLNAFHLGGNSLVLTWYAFMLCGLALIPFAIALSRQLPALKPYPGLALSAAIAGSLAGLMQAIGLSRWVFAVPMLASIHIDPASSLEAKEMAEMLFSTLNLWGGVAIGEHIGQALTVLFIASSAVAQVRDASQLNRLAGLVGLLGAAGITVGLGEGLAIALGTDGSAFSPATVGGYLAFSLWLILTGISMILSALKSR